MTSDEALMLEFQRGSCAVFEELFARHRQPFCDMRILSRDSTGGSNFLRIVLYDLKRRTETCSVSRATGKVLRNRQPQRSDGE
jgi:hypothetical protein